MNPARNPLSASLDLQRATLAARERTGDTAIGTNVSNGGFEVCRVTYPKGAKSVVTPLSARLPVADAIRFLDDLHAAEEVPE